MDKIKIIRIISIVGIICTIIALTCITLIVGDVKKNKIYNVQFYSDETLYFEYETNYKSVIKEPMSPKKDGYEFLGWYLNGKLFDFSSSIKSNIVLFAKWNKILDDSTNVSTTTTSTTTKKATTTKVKTTITTTTIPISTTTTTAESIVAKSLYLDQKTYYMFEGEELKINATINPDNIDNSNIRWSSSDESIASVDNNGVVKTHKFGFVKITAVIDDISKSVELIILETSKEIGYHKNVFANYYIDEKLMILGGEYIFEDGYAAGFGGWESFCDNGYQFDSFGFLDKQSINGITLTDFDWDIWDKKNTILVFKYKKC